MPDTQLQVVINMPVGVSQDALAARIEAILTEEIKRGYGPEFRLSSVALSKDALTPLEKLKVTRPEIYALFQRCAEIQTSKCAEYAKEAAPYRNYEQAGAGIGIKGWRYVLGRFAEKAERLANMIRKGTFGKDTADQEETICDLINVLAISHAMKLRDE